MTKLLSTLRGNSNNNNTDIIERAKEKACLKQRLIATSIKEEK